MNRKQFLQNFSVAASGVLIAPSLVQAQTDPKPAPINTERIKEFVIAGHGNMDKTKQMLQETPGLLYSAWDWGAGDFESALEGAGHVGNKEISNFLIEKGARTNLFVLTMLGKTALVKSYLEMYPAYINARGPHGLTLLHHAQKGGEDAKELLDYLQSKGLKETKIKM